MECYMHHPDGCRRDYWFLDSIGIHQMKQHLSRKGENVAQSPKPSDVGQTQKGLTGIREIVECGEARKQTPDPL